MSKFKVKLKIQGLELEIEGAREEASLIGQNIGQQLAGILGPAGNIIDGEIAESSISGVSVNQKDDEKVPRKPRKRRISSPRTSDESETSLLNFRHDPEKYGHAKQAWKVYQKALWLLYVMKYTDQLHEASASLIAKTFNKHFRQSGAITPSNVSRDLGKLKVETPPLVGEDNAKSPPAWYLLAEGDNRALALINGGNDG